MKHKYMHRLVICHFAVIMTMLAGCVPGEATEIGAMTKPEYEVIRINNCDGQADVTQEVERGQSIQVEREYGVTSGVDVFEGTITEKYGRSVSYSKSIALTAPPTTYMRFVIQWQNELHYGKVSRDEQALALYQYLTPTDIQILHQENIGCNFNEEPPLEIPAGETVITSLPNIWLPQNGEIPTALSSVETRITSKEDISDADRRNLANQWGMVMSYSQYYHVPDSDFCESNDISIVTVKSDLFRDSNGARLAIDWARSNEVTTSIPTVILDVGDFGYGVTTTTSAFQECEPFRDYLVVGISFVRYNIKVFVAALSPIGSSDGQTMMNYLLGLAIGMDNKVVSLAGQ